MTAQTPGPRLEFHGTYCRCCDPRLSAMTRKMTADLTRRGFVLGGGSVLVSAAALASGPVRAQGFPTGSPAVLFEKVRIFDGTGAGLTPPMNVLVIGNTIQRISEAPIQPPQDIGLIRIDGTGRTLTPGLIDAHTHLMFVGIPQAAMLTADVGFINVAAVKSAEDMLMRGITTARDVGGPVFGLKRGIDAGLVPGPRIWPSGAFISQTGGHGDFRLPNELDQPQGASFGERAGAAAIVDDVGGVRRAVRAQLALGASQIKMMAGGGVASSYDPLDVNQFSPEEMRAGVEAAANWNTYVTVHAYTPPAVRQAIAAGVLCIEHGQLLDEPTVQTMAEKGIWWSLQPFLDDQDANSYPEGSPNRKKQIEVSEGTDNAYRLAIKHKIDTAWGTDILFDAKRAMRQTAQLSKLVRWYSPAEVLAMATGTNARLLALSGPRVPYEGVLGLVQEGVLADLLLMEGDPLANLSLIDDPGTNFRVIMKDGVIYKNTLA